ncbi:terpene cyclase/mutase family protein [Luteolibacter sp. GHJ8]|jgi:squalene-hopene/tetraprenyl-beta-curcumene cyclase|uniref:Terpene cyclase/mutase family protein n=1 Tax=Luteolibacter rhizosphaerae TaxID=2989719 RepID=A0ABT3G2L9_9BACT|nr:prenyltransferase/squalene oxidase repeat-containing protein [Luteolibacter rhizosphaerae]MCW1914091.1 terpene cyclase/mutase family protein [Luteolibacter rhizosphaerae]
MKTAICVALASTMVLAQAQDSKNRYLSLQVEMKAAIARGNAWLAKQQKEDGHWDNAELPAFTALALTAAVRDPAVDRKADLPPHIAKGFEWLIAQQKDDGGIYNKGLSVYNTATAVTALTGAEKERYEPMIVKGRKHLIDQQWDIGQKKETDNKNDGGIGYGSKNDRSDMSNTYLAIEAIALSRKVIEDGKHGNQPDLDWDAAVTFLSRCQNLTETNDQPYASDDEKNKGGFIYGPGETKAGEETLPDGRVALRSYGSISYAGLLSLIYAKLGPDDPRVKTVKEWLGKNYTLEENPGMGAEGLYYYYQTMSKALSAAGIDKLQLADGKEADWRTDLAGAILKKQREDGSWANANGRWMESNPVLVTAYCVMSLEQLYYSIPDAP